MLTRAYCLFLASAFIGFADQRPTGVIEIREGFQWGPALTQSGFFLAIQHGFRIATEPGTRADLKGPFLRDYGRAVKGLSGWGDGDPFIVNYVGHPFAGAIAGFIQVQNDPQYRRAEFASDLYWRSRFRAMGFAAVYSAQFELGPASEASLGNVGLQPGTAGWCDLVTTPVGGFGVMLAEDALDRYLVRPLERKTGNRVLRLVLRGALNPNRTFANAMRLRAPWHRDTRSGVSEP